MVQSGHFPRVENRSGWRPGKRWMAILNSCRPFSETKAIVDCSAILPALLLYNALQQTAIKLLLCFFPLLSSPPLNTTLPCKSLMHFCVTQSVLWKQSSSCGLPEPRVCAPWLGQRGGMRAAKKISPSKNINCNMASGSWEILLEWVYHGKIGKNPKS